MDEDSLFRGQFRRMAERQLITHVIRNEYELAIAFARVCDQRDVLRFSGTILSSAPPAIWKPSGNCPNFHILRWFSRVILTVIGEYGYLNSQSFFLYLLKEMKHLETDFVHHFLFEGSTLHLDVKKQSQFLQALVAFNEYSPALFEALKSYIDPILNSINPELVVNFFGVNVFYYKKTFDSTFMSELSNIKVEQPTLLLTYLTCLQAPSVATNMQAFLTVGDRYPSRSKLLNASSRVVLINSTITLGNKHFFDRIALPAQSLLLSHDLTAFFKYTKAFPESQIYLLFSLFETFISKPLHFDEILKSFRDCPKAGLLNDVYTQIVNDFELIEYLNNVTMSNNSIQDLVDSSLIGLIRHVINSIDIGSFEKFSTKSYFAMVDSMRTKDFDFFFGYKALRAALQLVQSGKQSNIGFYLSHIEFKEVREAVVGDIFSLLFLQNKGSFVCDVSLMEKLLIELASFMHQSSLFSMASTRLLYAKLKQTNDPHECFRSSHSIVQDLLKKHDFDLAISIASHNPRLLKVTRLAIEVQKWRETKDSMNLSDDLKQNLGLSTNHEFPGLFYDDQTLRHVHERRLQLPEPTETQSVVRFNRYLELFNKMESLVGVSGCDAPSHRRIVELIVKTAKIQDINTISELLGPSSVEFVLAYQSFIDHSSNIYEVIRSQCPATAGAILYENRTKSDVSLYLRNLNVRNVMVLERFFSEKSKNTRGILYKQTTQEEFVRMAEQAFTFSPIDIDSLNEIFYQSPKAFSLVSKKYIRDTSLADISELEAYSGFESLLMLQKIGVMRTNLHQTLRFLFNSSHYTTLRLFLRDFELWDEFAVFLADLLSKDFDRVENIPTDLLDEVSRFFSDELHEQINVYKQQHLQSREDNLTRSESSLILKEYQLKRANVPTVYAAFRLLSTFLDSVYEMNLDLTNQQLTYEIFTVISMIEVSEDDTESRFCAHFAVLLRKLHTLSGLLDDLTISKLNTLGSFLDLRLYSKYNCEYSFNGCLSGDGIRALVQRCYDYDYEEPINQFCSLWGLDVEQLLVQRAISAFRIGLIEEGEAIITKLPAKPQKFNPPGIPLLDDVINYLSFPIVLNATDPTGLYHHLQDTTSTFLIADSPQILTLNRVVGHFGENWRVILFHAINGNFTMCFDLLESIAPQNRMTVFINSVVNPALTRRLWNSFWIYMKRHETTEYVNCLIEYLHQRTMFVILFDIYSRLGRFEEAIETLIESLVGVTNWLQEQKVVHKIESLAEEAQGFIVDTTAIETNRQKALFQLKLCQLCINQSAQFNPSLNIFGNAQRQMASLVYMLSNYQFEDVLDILPFIDTPLNVLCRHLVDLLLQQGEVSIRKFFKAVRELNAQSYSILAFAAIAEMGSRMQTQKEVMNFIKQNAVGDHLKTRLFIHFGYLEKAFQKAKTLKDLKLIQTILDRAVEVNNSGVALECLKLLGVPDPSETD